MLKKILISLISIIVLLLIIALFLPKDFKFEKSIDIRKNKIEVYNYIKYLKNQDNWSVWAKMDPNMKKEYSGTDGTPGFISRWDGNDDVGKGEQKIISLIENSRIDYEIKFTEPWESKSPAWISVESIDSNTTLVFWGMSGKMPYPTNLFSLFMDMENMLGKDMQEGLKNLKTEMEKE